MRRCRREEEWCASPSGKPSRAVTCTFCAHNRHAEEECELLEFTRAIAHEESGVKLLMPNIKPRQRNTVVTPHLTNRPSRTNRGRGTPVAEEESGAARRSGSEDKEDIINNEETGQLKWTYLNVNRGDANTQGIRETGKDMDAVFIAEPPIHTRGGNFFVSSLKSLRPINRIQRKTKLAGEHNRRHLRRARAVSNRGGTSTAMTINKTTLCTVYLPGNWIQKDLSEHLEYIYQWIGRGTRADIMGDFNSGMNSRRSRVSEEWIGQKGIIRAGTKDTTTWFRDMGERVVTSCLNLVLASPNKPFIPGPHNVYFTGYNHCVLGGVTTTDPPSPQLEVTQIDWTWWEEYVNKDKNPQGGGASRGTSAYATLALITSQHLRPVRISLRSKKWGDTEVTTQLEQTRGAPLQGGHHEGERTTLKKMIKKKKRESWEKVLTENRRNNPWEIVRLSRNPYGTHNDIHNICTQEERVLTTTTEKFQGFQEHNLCWAGDPIPTLHTPPTNKKPPNPETVRKVRQALSKPSSTSTAGPDRIIYSLLELRKVTRLGQEVLEEIATCVDARFLPEQAREITMVMIPKPGKDQRIGKGFRPIVLA